MKNAVLVLLLVGSQYIQAQKANFIDNDWQKATAEAKKQGKYLFVDAYTDWCYWCKVMDKQTFAKDEVGAYMNKTFVNLKMEMEHNYGQNVAMKYRVNSFPTYLVFNPEGKLVYRISGYLEAKAFLAKLEEVQNPKLQTLYPGISDQVDLEFPAFYKKAFGGNNQREYPDSLTLLNYLNQQQNLYSEVNYDVMAQFSAILPTKYQQHFLNNQQKYADLYSKAAIDDIVYSLAYKKLGAAIEDSSETGLDNTLAFVDNYVKGDKDKEETKTYYRIRYYEMTGGWAKFAGYVDEYIRTNKEADGDVINQWAWSVYEKCDDKAIIEKAAAWMKPVVEKKPQYASTDTYAALLYKSGKLKDAETYANKAIALGKKEGQKTESTEELLGKIKQQK